MKIKNIIRNGLDMFNKALCSVLDEWANKADAYNKRYKR